MADLGTVRGVGTEGTCVECGKPLPIVRLFCPWQCPARACSPACLAAHERGHVERVKRER